MTLKDEKIYPLQQDHLMLKLYMNHSNPSLRLHDYSTLQEFKKQIEIEKSGAHHRPYESMLKRAFIYRLVFLSLGALFFFFTVFMYQQSINWLPYSYIFSNDLAAKNLILALCTLFSFAAFGMSFAISAEKEALDQLVHRSRKKLSRMYKKQRIFLELTENYAELKKLHQLYSEAKHKINDMKESSRALLHLIGKSKNKKKTATLFNEALLESNDQLHIIINKFRKNNVVLQG